MKQRRQLTALLLCGVCFSILLLGSSCKMKGKGSSGRTEVKQSASPESIKNAEAKLERTLAWLNGGEKHLCTFSPDKFQFNVDFFSNQGLMGILGIDNPDIVKGCIDKLMEFTASDDFEIIHLEPFFLERVPLEQRFLILRDALGWGKNSNINVIHLILGTYLSDIRGFSQKEFFDALGYAQTHVSPQSVSYDGELGTQIYTDKELEKSIFIIAYTLWSNRPDTIEEFKANDFAKLFAYDTNTADDQSRIEPFDLVANMMTKIVKNQMNFEMETIDASIKNSVRENLKDFFGISESKNPLIVEENKNGISIICYNRKLNIDPNSSYFFSNPLFYKEIHNYNDLTYNHSIEIECNGDDYKIDFEQVKGEAISPPADIQEHLAKKESIDFTIYVTLADEVNENYKQLFSLVMRAFGFMPLEQTSMNAVSEFESTLKQSDVIILAGHLLGAYQLDLGTETNRILTFEKSYPNHKKAKIKVVLPDSPIKKTLKKSEIDSLYAQRLLVNRNPLFVFVTSCYSQGNTLMWPAIYRSALASSGNAELATRRDLPHVIASSRGFGTDSIADIASHLFYPLDVIDQVAVGRSVAEIHQILLTRKYGTFYEEVSQRFKIPNPEPVIQFFKDLFGGQSIRSGFQRFLYNKKHIKPSEGTTFEPVYNLSDANRELSLRISKNQLKIIKKETGQAIYTLML